MKKFTILIFVLLIVIIPPILVNVGGNNLAIVSQGEFNNWLGFWGSYIGAIIGASSVYFVSRLQMKKQYELQIKAIELENKQSTKREMKKFYLTNKLEKNEEIQKILDTISSIIINLNNEYIEFTIYSDANKKNMKSTRNVDLNESIYILRKNLQKNYFQMVSELGRLSVLSGYIEKFEKNSLFIQNEFIKLYDEIKRYYYTENIHIEILDNPDEPYILENAELILKKITYLKSDILQNDLKNILEEIQDYINN